MKLALLDQKQKVQRWLGDKDIIEAQFDEAINSSGQLMFSVPISKGLDQSIMYVAVARPQGSGYVLFKIVKPQVMSDRVQYTAIEAAYDELKSYAVIRDVRPQNRTAGEMLALALMDTRWTVGVTYTKGASSTNFYYITPLEAIQKIAGIFSLEVTFEIDIDRRTNQITRRRVNLYAQQGDRTGKRFEYGSNLLTVTREENTEDLITALIGRGKGEEVSEGGDDSPDGYGRRITFADVVWSKKNGNPADKPAGIEYVEDVEATKAYGFSDGKPRIGIQIFEEITDPAELLQATWSALQSLKRPQVSFKADVLDVGDLKLGDTVAIIRHDIGIEYFTRVYKVTHNLLNERLNTIELGDDLSGSSITRAVSSLSGAVESVKETAGYAVVSADGKSANYYGQEEPAKPVEGDLWYKDLGNGETDMYQYHEGAWILIQSTRALELAKKAVDEKAKELEAKVKEGDTTLDGKIEAVKSDATEIEKKVASARSEAAGSAAALQTEIEAANRKAQTIQDDVVKARSEASTATSKLREDMNGKNEQFTNDLTVLSKSLATTQGDVTKLDVRIGEVSASVVDADGKINQVKVTANGAQALASDNQGKINKINIDIGGINAILADKATSAELKASSERISADFTKLSDKVLASGHRVKVQSVTFNSAGNYNDAGVWIDGTKVGSVSNGIKFTMGSFNLDWTGYTQKNYTYTSVLVSDLLALRDKIVVIYMADTIPSYGSDLIGALEKMGGSSNTATTSSYTRKPFLFIGMSLNASGKQVLKEGEGYLNAGENGDGQTKFAWAYEGDTGKLITSNVIDRMSSFQVDLDGLRSTVNDLNGKAATFQADINGLQSSVSDGNGKLSNLQNTVDGLSTTVKDQSGKLTKFSVTVDGLETTTSNQAGDISLLRTDINGMNQTVKDHTGRITQIQSDVNGVRQTVAAKVDNATMTTYVEQQGNSWKVEVDKKITDGTSNLMSKINVEAGSILFQSKKLFLAAESTVFGGSAFIPDAAISNLSADKITAGTLNAGLINVINLNASNITTGTINGANLKIDLNNGEVQFKRGRITSVANTLNIDIDTGPMSVTDGVNNGVYFANGELKLMDDPLNITGTPKYGGLRRSAHIWSPGSAGAELHSPNGVFVGSDNYNGAFAGGSGIDGTSSGAALAVDKDGSATLNGANIVSVSGGSAYDIGYSMKNRPAIILGKSQSGWNQGDRTFIQGAFVHIESAYRNTNGASPNVYVAPDGALVRSTSASKYKTDIQRSYVSDYGERLLELPTATWMDKAETERYVDGESQDKPVRHFGMIAEDLADAGLEMLVSRGQDGELEGIQYDRIGPALIPVIKQLQDKVNKLEEKLNEQ